MRRALVIGCSNDVWSEVELAQDICLFDAIYCVKLAGVHWRGGRFVWATLHPEFMDDYEKQRAQLGLHSDYEIVAPLAGEVGMHGKKGRITRRVTYRYPGMNASASSGGYAAKVALEDGFDRVVLAGVPMEQSGAHFTRGKPWLQRDSFMRGFKDSIPHFAGRVRSMSGWTAQELGVPTLEWLTESQPAA
jgi:hypothetical protein